MQRLNRFVEQVQALIAVCEQLPEMVGPCAHAVPEINELCHKRDTATDELHENSDEQARASLERTIDAYKGDIRRKRQPFDDVEAELRTFLARLGGALSMIPVHPPEARVIRDEIERLSLVLAARKPGPMSMISAKVQLPVIEMRLQELVDCLEATCKATPAPARSTAKRRDPEVAKRRLIVRQNPRLRASELCKRFDFETVELPSKFTSEFEVKAWEEAYKIPQLRQRIDTMVSKDKKVETV